jgi:transglutaminase-like putative cysteine protease
MFPFPDKESLPMILRSFLFALALAALPAFADDTNFTAAQWSPVDAKTAMAAAAQITPAQYPNCDSAIVEQKSVRVYHADGTGACQDETFTKVLTEKGRRDNREQTLFFMLPYWTVEVPKLEIIKADGTVVPVDVAANSKVAIDDSQMAENIYDPNSKVLTVNIPQLDIGDTIHMISQQIIHRSIMPSEYDEENVFEGTSFIRHISYEVHAPASLPLVRIGLRDEVSGTITSTTQTNGTEVVYHWDVNNVPRMFDEPNMPPYDEVLQRVMVSTVPQWQDISKWYWNLSKPHLDMITPEMQETNRLLIANATMDMDKIKALFYFVSNKIRYMGRTPETDRPGFEPHDVCLTFDRKYGVCRDKAGLLVEMLRLAGFKAYPVLINIGAKRDPEVPQPDFDHAIVAVELKPGEYTLMDPTDENTRDLLPAPDRNRSYLVCKPEGETIKISPVQPPEKHMLYVKTTGTLNADGILTATSDFSFEGVNDDAYRNAFSQLKPDEQKDFFEGRLKDAIPGVKLTSLTVTPENVLDTTVPLHAELKFTASGLTANGDHKSIVNLPWISKNLGVANRLLLDVVGLKQRKYPLDTEVTCGVREDVSLKLEGGFDAPLSVPEFSPVNDDCVAYNESVAFANDTLTCSRDFRLKTVEFSPSEYLQLRQTLKDMDYDRRKSLILALNSKGVKEAVTMAKADEVPPVQSNAKILSSEKSLTITDAHSAVYHVKYSKLILTYDGKIRESDVKINYNPACEDARIVHAVVTSKDGSKQEISPGEISAMDQGWDAGAKRYTAGKVLVASLPDVEIGSTIEVEYEVTMKSMPFLAGFEPFQFPDDLDDKSFTVTAPAGLPIQTIVSGSHGIVKEHHNAADGKQTFQWHSADVKALPAEPDLPPIWSYQSGVSYFIGDASDYWRTLSLAMVAHAQKGGNAAELVRQLTASAKTKLDAVKAIRDYIAENIRVAGPSFTELPLHELSDADTTLADGYGHAADCAILYYAMLQAAGFQPEFIIASDLPPVSGITDVTKSFPLPNDFQTPLVKITVDGEDYYLNDTDQYAQLGTTATDGKQGIALADQKLMTIHAAKGCGNKTETDYAVSLSNDGNARIEISRWFYGQYYNDNNEFFSELPPEEREHYFQEAVSRVAQGARAASDLTTKFDAYPGLEKFTVELDHYGIPDGKYLYFNLPFTPTLFGTLSDERTLPLYVPDESENILRADIQLPEGFRETDIVPKDETFSAPGGSQAHITRTDADGKTTVTADFETAPGLIKPKNYPSLLNIQSALGSRSGTTFLLEREN